MPNVTTIGDYAFFYCSALAAIEMPNVTTIGYGAFVSCSALTAIELPNVTTIGYSAFISCSALTAIELPSSVTSIGEYAFAMTGISTLTLNWSGDQILSYDSDWFLYSNSLTTIYIPSGTTADYVNEGWPEGLVVSY
ncbi:MAG: leucine-rich repeat domain-containing protein, partial [Rikenellaceae bacterium]